MGQDIPIPVEQRMKLELGRGKVVAKSAWEDL